MRKAEPSELMFEDQRSKSKKGDQPTGVFGGASAAKKRLPPPLCARTRIVPEGTPPPVGNRIVWGSLIAKVPVGVAGHGNELPDVSTMSRLPGSARSETGFTGWPEYASRMAIELRERLDTTMK